jgi:CheY-like chemotaxis protein
MMDILVIDDDELFGDILARFFRRKGFAGRVAHNGADALAILSHQPRPVLIVCDIIMPIMNGFAFRRQQLQDPALAGIPTIMMSGHARFKRRVMRLGIDVFLIKPFAHTALEQALIRYGLAPQTTRPAPPSSVGGV